MGMIIMAMITTVVRKSEARSLGMMMTIMVTMITMAMMMTILAGRKLEKEVEKEVIVVRREERKAVLLLRFMPHMFLRWPQ